MEKNEEKVQEKTGWREKAKTAGKWLLGVAAVVGSAAAGWYAHSYAVKEDMELAKLQRDYQARKGAKNND